MSFWKKIIKAVTSSPITKGVSIDKISKMVNKTGSSLKDVSKIVQGKGWKGFKGFGGGQGVKIITSKLKKGTKIFGSKLAQGAKQLMDQKVLPGSKQVLQKFDKATESVKKSMSVSQETLRKLNRLNPKAYASKAYQSLKSNVDSAKQKANNATASVSNLKTSFSSGVSKLSQSFKVGSKSFYKQLIKFLALGIFVYGIALSIPKQIRRYYIRKQELNFQRQKMEHQQRLSERTETTRQRALEVKNINKSFKSQEKGETSSNAKYDEAFDYAKIRQREIAKLKEYES